MSPDLGLNVRWRIGLYRRLRELDLSRREALHSALVMRPMGTEMRREIEEAEADA